MRPSDADFNFLNGGEPHSLLLDFTTENDDKRKDAHPDGIKYDIWLEGWGHQLTPPEPSELLQLQIQPNRLNVESTKSDSTIKVVMQKINELGVGMVCMPETNLDWRQTKTHEEYKNNLIQYWKYSKTTFASSTIGGMCSTYLPGGTGSTVFGKWNGYCLGSGQDESGMGRWAWHKTRRKGDEIIIFITAYRVPQDSKPAGDINAYTQ